MVQFPFARMDAPLNHFPGFLGVCPAQIGLMPDAPPVRIDFAVAVAAAAAGAVTDVLWTTRFRALEGQVLDGAVSALTASEHDLFANVFGKIQKPARRSVAVAPAAQALVQGGQRRIWIKEKTVRSFHQVKMEL